MERKQLEGRVIDGRFHLGQYLGGSAHSAVFLTEYGEQTPQKAAIKLASADSDKAQTWLLRRELGQRLSHPGLLSIFQFGTCRIDAAALIYVVMEPADDDLSQVVPLRCLAPAEAREMLMAVVETLAYVHAEGFVHGRLTPANIMAAGDRIKISSDGLLRTGESIDDAWAPNGNEPPESHSGMTPAGDVWSLGMTLVEVLTQRAPAGDPGGTNDPAVPETLEAPFLDIARRCLRADPRLRCSLAEIAHALMPSSPAPKAAVPSAKAAPKRRKYLLPLTVAIVGGALVTGAILTRGRLADSPPGAEPHALAVTDLAGEVLPDGGAKMPDAPRPQSMPAARGTAGGEVVDRFVPDVSPAFLGTIRGKVTVSVRVKIDPSGAVVDAGLNSRPGSRYFDRLSLDAARRWRFQPAEAGSTRVVRFEFRSDGCDAFSDGARR